jgi:Fe-S cluster biogenesis protein NfuA
MATNLAALERAKQRHCAAMHSTGPIPHRRRKPSMGKSLDNVDLKERVTRVLAEQVGPTLQMDGTAIEVLDVADGVARVRLGGALGCCPSSVMTVIMGIEQELRKHVPEVAYLEAVP